MSRSSMNDRRCVFENKFLCQVNCVSPPSVAPTSTPTKSPVSALLVEECVDDIQLIFFDTKLTFNEAQLRCEDIGEDATLAVPINEEFFTRIVEFKERVNEEKFVFFIHLGLFDPVGDLRSDSQGNQTKRFVSVVDRVVPSFTSGFAGQFPWLGLDQSNIEAPRDLNQNADCVVFSQGRLRDVFCNFESKFICQAPCTKEPTKAPTKSPTSPSGAPTTSPTISPITPDVVGECSDKIQLFYFDIDTVKVNFSEAQKFCESLGQSGNLAVPTSQDFMLRMLELTLQDTFWFGLTDLNGVNVEEPQTDITDRFVSVIDGIAPNFTSGAAGVSPWANGSPRDFGGSKDCLSLNFGFLFDVSCSFERGFMCQLSCPASPTANPTLLPTQTQSLSPTKAPTKQPTKSPSLGPTINPSTSPSLLPTEKPTKITQNPTLIPTVTPLITDVLPEENAPAGLLFLIIALVVVVFTFCSLSLIILCCCWCLVRKKKEKTFLTSSDTEQMAIIVEVDDNIIVKDALVA